MSEPPPHPAGAIAPLDSLPVFLQLGGRRAVVGGGGAGAAWKVELLAAAGASVEVFAERFSDEMLALAARVAAVALVARAWSAEDLAGAAIAILEASGDEEARAFREAARGAGALANVIDRAEFCDFAFGSIVNRSPLVVAISTGGAAPVFGQAIRARLEAILPASLALWARAARQWRARLAPLELDFRQRRGFWERFAELALGAGTRAPTDADLDALAAARDAHAAEAGGEIVLVGAGPGDPDLLTLKAVAALNSADVILHDKLASPRLLDLARREAKRIDVGKRAGAPSPSQAEITAMLIDFARAGKRVVRLKSGDPSVFGRANEEIFCAREAGSRITVVPGVTAAFAAAADIVASLTDRDLAPRLQLASAHEGDGPYAKLNWPALAAPDATTAIYMGARTLKDVVRRLIAEGLDPATPAFYLANVSLADAVRIAAPIVDLPARVSERNPEGPGLILYGRALGAREAL